MNVYLIALSVFLGFAFYPWVVWGTAGQRHHALMLMGGLGLAILCVKPFAPPELHWLDPSNYQWSATLASLSFLLFASGLAADAMMQVARKRWLALCIIVGTSVTILGILLDRFESLFAAVVVQIACLSIIVRQSRLPLGLAQHKTFFLAGLYSTASFATQMQVHSLVYSEYIELVANGLGTALLLCTWLAMVLDHLNHHGLRTTQSSSTSGLEISALRLAYRSRRVLKDFRHDLRQPLSTLGILASVGKAISQDPEVMARYQHIQTAQRALKSMLDDLFFQLENTTRYPDASPILAKLQMVNLCDVLDPLVEEYRLLAQTKDLQLRYVRPEIEVHTNVEALTKILRNGLDNAIKYTQQGGVVVGSRMRQGQLCIQIVDTGPGIESDRISAGHKGWGHGSTIIQELSDQILAKTACTSRVRLGSVRGSVFEVQLPSLHETQQALQNKTEHQNESLLSARVLAFSNQGLQEAQNFLPENLFDIVHFCEIGTERVTFPKITALETPVFISYASTIEERALALAEQNHIESNGINNACWILLYPSQGQQRPLVEFTGQIITIAYPQGEATMAFKILEELFPQRPKKNPSGAVSNGIHGVEASDERNANVQTDTPGNTTNNWASAA